MDSAQNRCRHRNSVSQWFAGTADGLEPKVKRIAVEGKMLYEGVERDGLATLGPRHKKCIRVVHVVLSLNTIEDRSRSSHCREELSED